MSLVGVHYLLTQSAGGTRPVRELGSGFKEGEPLTGRFLAIPAVFGPKNLHFSGHGDVLDALKVAFSPTRRNDTAIGRSRREISLDHDLAPAIGIGAGGDCTVVGQVEDADGGVECRPGRLSQGSWYCSRLND